MPSSPRRFPPPFIWNWRDQSSSTFLTGHVRIEKFGRRLILDLEDRFGREVALISLRHPLQVNAFRVGAATCKY